MTYKLLARFAEIFEGAVYKHRNSTLGDSVAACMYLDLYDMGKSAKFRAAVDNQTHAINKKNKRVGINARRGDGTFGERVPNTPATPFGGSLLVVGDIATIEIGTEVKVLAKAMIKQLDRVGTDMVNQLAEFKRDGGQPICVGIVGVNHADHYTGYEGERAWLTDGKKHKHPIQEAAQAEERLLLRIRPEFDTVIVLRFRATNEPPFAFAWVDAAKTEAEYGAALVRISREYESRF